MFQNKPKENKIQSAVKSLSTKRDNGEHVAPLTDNRPGAIAKNAIQKMVSNNQQVKQLRPRTTMIDNRPQAKKAAQLQAMAGNFAAQQQTIQLMTFSRFSGWSRLTNWVYNDREHTLMEREKELSDLVAGIRTLCEGEPGKKHAPKLATLGTELIKIKTGNYSESKYDSVGDKLDSLIDTAMSVFSDEQNDIYREEHAVYQEVDRPRITKVRKKQLLNQMDRLQKRHVKVIGLIHELDLPLTVPGQAAMTAAEAGRLADNWNDLRTESGVIRSSDDATDHDRANLLSHHARLLSGAHGRNLLDQLLHPEDNGHTVAGPLTITPTLAEENPAERRRMLVRKEELEREKTDLETKIRAVNAKMNVLADDSPALPALIAQSDRLNERYMAVGPEIVTIVEGLGSAASAQPGGLAVHVKRNLKDSDELSEGQNARHIVSPAFITYGHELIHVLHNRTNTRRMNGYPVGSPHKRWTNEEEHNTIAGLPGAPASITENQLRSDHLLSNRTSHGGKSREVLEMEGHL